MHCMNDYPTGYDMNQTQDMGEQKDAPTTTSVNTRHITQYQTTTLYNHVISENIHTHGGFVAVICLLMVHVVDLPLNWMHCITNL